MNDEVMHTLYTEELSLPGVLLSPVVFLLPVSVELENDPKNAIENILTL